MGPGGPESEPASGPPDPASEPASAPASAAASDPASTAPLLLEELLLLLDELELPPDELDELELPPDELDELDVLLLLLEELLLLELESEHPVGPNAARAPSRTAEGSKKCTRIGP